MNVKQYIAIMFFATTLCWVALLFVITNVDPFSANFVAMLFFYLSLFLALMGTISLTSLPFYRSWGAKELSIHRYVRKSFRNGLFFSTIITSLLFLQGRGLLHLWNFTIFVIIVALIISFSILMRTYSR